MTKEQEEQIRDLNDKRWIVTPDEVGILLAEIDSLRAQLAESEGLAEQLKESEASKQRLRDALQAISKETKPTAMDTSNRRIWEAAEKALNSATGGTK